jgi:hypothetical protein
LNLLILVSYTFLASNTTTSFLSTGASASKLVRSKSVGQLSNFDSSLDSYKYGRPLI